MTGIENLFHGFQIAVTPFNLFVAVLGIMLGTIIGVLPGLGGRQRGVAILLPAHVHDAATSAIILLTSLYWGALFGRRDHLRALQHSGRALVGGDHVRRLSAGPAGAGGQALTAAFTSSFVGALFSIVLITFFAPLRPRSR